MRSRFLITAILLLTTAGLDNCARRNNPNEAGSADRTAQPADQTPNSRPTSNSGATGREPAGNTAGAGSGNLDTHERGGGSTGSADRHGSTATRPSREAPPNVDPSRSQH